MKPPTIFVPETDRIELEHVAETGQSLYDSCGLSPGYAGPAPEGMDYSDWLAFNNID